MSSFFSELEGGEGGGAENARLMEFSFSEIWPY